MDSEVVSFIIREKDGTIFQPWKNIKNLRAHEWIRDGASILTADTRVIESATYAEIKKDVPVYHQDGSVEYYNVAYFYDDKDGKPYDVAERLVKESAPYLKINDTAVLQVRGCCSVCSVNEKGKWQSVKIVQQQGKDAEIYIDGEELKKATREMWASGGEMYFRNKDNTRWQEKQDKKQVDLTTSTKVNKTSNKKMTTSAKMTKSKGKGKKATKSKKGSKGK